MKGPLRLNVDMNGPCLNADWAVDRPFYMYLHEIVTIGNKFYFFK